MKKALIKNTTSRLHTVGTNSITSVDEETGEVVTKKEVKEVLVHDEKLFLQLYYAVEAYLCHLTGMEMQVFMHLCFEANGKNRAFATPNVKEEIAEKINLSKTGERKSSAKSVSQAILKLVEKEMLTKKGVFEYEVNPRFIWRGKAKDREFLIKQNLKDNRNA